MKAAALVVACLLLVAACTAEEGGAGIEDQVVVSAASSLTDVFTAVATAFEARYPGTDAVVNLAGSSTLREQILAGAPVDVFASADAANIEAVAQAGRITGDVLVFARNRLVVAVPAGNPAGINDLADLARPELLIGLCDPAVPCGALAARLGDRAAVEFAVDSYEPNVRALLTKLEEGELDVGLVYATDVAAAGGRAETVDLPLPDVTTDYTIAVVADPPHPEAATAMVEFVASDQVRDILRRMGFEVP